MSLIRGCLSAKLNLSYPHHNSEFVQSLASYFQRENFLDLVFICDKNVHVKAHKAVLSSISQFIKNIVLPHGQEIVYVNLPDVDHQKMQLLLDFLYDGVSKVDSKELSSLQEILTLLCIHIPTAVIMAVTAVPNNTATGTSEDKKPTIPLNPNLRIVPADSYNLLNGSGDQFYNSGVNGNMTLSTVGMGLSSSQIHGFPLQSLNQFNEKSISGSLTSATTTFGMFSPLQPIRIKQEKIDDIDMNSGSVSLNSVISSLNSSSNTNVNEVLLTNSLKSSVLPLNSPLTQDILLNKDLNKLVPEHLTPVSMSVPATPMEICSTPPVLSESPQDTQPITTEEQIDSAVSNSKSHMPDSAVSNSKSHMPDSAVSNSKSNIPDSAVSNSKSHMPDSAVSNSKSHMPDSAVSNSKSHTPDSAVSNAKSHMPDSAVSNSKSHTSSSNVVENKLSDISVPSKNQNEKIDDKNCVTTQKDSSTNSDAFAATSAAESTIHVGEKSRRKTIFTVEMVSLMEEKFQEDKYPNIDYVTKFSEEKGVPLISVKRWFSHRREKHKRETLAKEKADKKKEMFTAKQIETLESKYKVDKHPSAVILKGLATEFEYPISLIERWFRQRREKDEKDSKNAVETVALPSESEVPVSSVSDSVTSWNKAESSTMIVTDKEGGDDIKITPETVHRSRSSTPRSTASRSSIKDQITPRMTRSSQEDLKKEQDVKIESSEHSRSSTPRSTASGSSTKDHLTPRMTRSSQEDLKKEQDLKIESSERSRSSTPRSTASRSSTRDSSKETPQSAKLEKNEVKDSPKESPQSSESVKNDVEDSPKTLMSPVKRRVLRGSTKIIPTKSRRRPANRTFNDDQLVILESEFKKNNFPETEVFMKLSQQLKTSVPIIRRWFAHRREKARKELKMKTETKNKIVTSTWENEKSVLEVRFQKEKYPSPEFVEDMSKKMNRPPSSIRKWFSRRRQQDRQLGNTYQRANDAQREILDTAFKSNNFPDRETYQQLSADTQLPLKFVMRWFVDQRFRMRKRHMNRAASLLKSSVTLARGKQAITSSRNPAPKIGHGVKAVHKVSKKVVSSVTNKNAAQHKRTSQKNPKQIEMLEIEYKKNPYPTSDRYQELCLLLKLGINSVRSWFKMKRKRTRTLIEARKVAAAQKLRKENVSQKKDSNRNDGDKQSGKKEFTKFSQEQKQVLEKMFQRNMNPSTEVCQRLGQRLNLNARVVFVWFQNRRAKFRRESLNATEVQKISTESTRQISGTSKRTASLVTPRVTSETTKTQPETEDNNEDMISQDEEQEPQSKKRKLSITQSTEGTTVPWKKGRRFTDAEKEILEKQFSKNMYPTATDFEEIAEILQIPLEPVRTWFVSRRKYNREPKTSPQVTKPAVAVKNELTSFSNKKIKRTVFSEWQRHVLEKEYRKNPFPDLDVMGKVATELKLPSRAIIRWYRNRRKRAGIRVPSSQKPAATCKPASVSQEAATEIILSNGSDDEKEQESTDVLESVQGPAPASSGDKCAEGYVIEDLLTESSKELNPVKEKKKFVFKLSQENVLEELYQSSGMPDEAMLDCLKTELQLPNTEVLSEWFIERATNGMTDPEPFKCSWGGCTQKFSDVDALERHFISHSKLVITVKPEL